MQSTHNTISSLVGIKMKCNGYNITYAHKELSFDSAMYDAWLQLRLGMIDSALVGGHDEMTPSYFKLLEKAGYLGQQSQLAGETAVSFVIGSKPKDKHLCRFGGIRMMYCPDKEEIARQLHELLGSANVPMSDVSGVLTSMNGNAGHDAYISKLCGNLFSDIPLLRYKHLFGESYTASGLGLYVAATCLSKGRIPESLYVDINDYKPLKPKALLLLNTTDEKCCSLMLVTI
jgi:3-oxoacyl-(acyl-carrier-protein) synthase